jgi:hypothetical protein
MIVENIRLEIRIIEQQIKEIKHQLYQIEG